MIRSRSGIDRVVQRATLTQTIRYPIYRRQGLSTTTHFLQASQRESEKQQPIDDSLRYEDEPLVKRDIKHHDKLTDALQGSKGGNETKKEKSTPGMGSLAQALGGWTSVKERLEAVVHRQDSEGESSNFFETQWNQDKKHDLYFTSVSKKRKSSPPATPPQHAPKQDTPELLKPLRSKGRKGRKSAPIVVKVARPKKLLLKPIEEGEKTEVPHLAYGLDKVLFNTGVYQIQDQRSKVYNFDPYLTSIMPIEQFDFDALKAYITSSKDTKLRSISAKHGKKYCGSTSSMTSILSQFHFLISQWREPNFSNLSKNLRLESRNYTALTRTPAAAYARLQDGVYAIDADKEYDRENVLSMLGKSMEKLLTLPKEEFEKYRINRSHLLTEEERNADEAYHYTTLGDFMMRSQLDAYDPRLPGTGVFDLKTRAVLTIRMDVHDYENRRGYELTRRFGQFGSYEREYHDMIRSAFLKYSLQVRMGRMDGIFVAFHNTQRIFGFQYIPLEEMDNSIHHSVTRDLGDYEFRISLKMLNDLLDRATKKFPGRSLRLIVETRQARVPFMYFFAEPVSDEEMKESDEASTESAIKLAEEIIDQSQREREALELSQQEEQELEKELESTVEDFERPIDEHDAKSDDVWEALMVKVEETIENESLGKDFVRESLHDALETANVLRDRTATENEQYLDALVESLTDASPGSREILEASETNLAGERSSEHDPSATSAQGDETPVNLQEGLSAAVQASESDISPTDSTVETAPKHGTSAAVAQEDETSTNDRASLSPLSQASKSDTLRDLILKVTKGIEDKKVEELGKFERMLAELAAKTKQTGIKPDDETAYSETSFSQSQVDNVASSIDKSSSDETPQPAQKAKSASARDASTYTPPEELFGMVVTVRNRVNGKWVERPEGPNGKKLDWLVEYGMKELGDVEARTVYEHCRKRRHTHFDANKKNEKTRYQQDFQGMMLRLSQKGARLREVFEDEQKGKDLLVAWDKKPLFKGDQ